MEKSLGEYIRELREKKDYSLRELAKKIDLSAAFLSDVELGRRHPTDKVLARIAKELGTTIEKMKDYDTRAPIKEMRRLVNENPAYGVVFRKLLNKKLSPEELMTIIGKGNKGKKK